MNRVARTLALGALSYCLALPSIAYAQQAPLFEADWSTVRNLPDGPTQSGSATTRFANGGYEITTTRADVLTTFAPGATGPFLSFTATVEFANVEGPDSVAALTLVGGGPAYMVAVTPAQREVQAFVVTGNDFLSARPATIVDSIQPNGRNTLSVTFSGSQISAAINGQPVLSFAEGTGATSYRVGITGGTGRLRKAAGREGRSLRERSLRRAPPPRSPQTDAPRW